MNTAGEWLERCEQALVAASVEFGHGTDNARDESAWLVLHVLGAPLDGSFADWGRKVKPEEAARISRLLERRIEERQPLAYLLGEAWFCGLRFQVNASVLVPRSPIAELIRAGFAPWVNPNRVRRVLDLCTGSGCIAIAIAHYLPDVTVDAVDISADALEVARVNVRRHDLGERVRLWQSDLFEGLEHRKWDLIVSNPPYVSEEEIRQFPLEYGWEPRLGFQSSEDGLGVVLKLLREAPGHLEKQGVLICEVGQAADRLQARLPDLPLTWLEFEHGGEGVFTIDRSSLEQALMNEADPGIST